MCVSTVWPLRRLHPRGQGAGILPEDARQEEVQVNVDWVASSFGERATTSGLSLVSCDDDLPPFRSSKLSAGGGGWAVLR